MNASIFVREKHAEVFKTKVFVYGKLQKLEYATFNGLLKEHKRPVKVILVKGLRKVNLLLFTNDLKLTVKQVIVYLSWSL